MALVGERGDRLARAILGLLLGEGGDPEDQSGHS